MYRNHFPFFGNNSSVHYLDSAASSIPCGPAVAAAMSYDMNYPANIHRGLYDMSAHATEEYEQARQTLAAFFGAEAEEIIFTSGTTDGLNMLARMLAPRLTEGRNIVLTAYEHHANLIPWQKLASETGVELRFIPITEAYELDFAAAKELIDDQTAIVSFGSVSNTLGTIAPTKELISLAKQVNAFTIMDAAQEVAHRPIHVEQLGVDALVCSGHKMYGPTGIGVLFLAKKWHEVLSPVRLGGDMIKTVSYTSAVWADAPQKFEAGTPPIAAAIGLAAAAKLFFEIGWENIIAHEEKMMNLLTEALSECAGITIIGPEGRCSVASFTHESAHPHDIAEILNRHSVAVRAGHHCTMPLMKSLGLPGTARASVGLYTSKEDIEALRISLKVMHQIFS